MVSLGRPKEATEYGLKSEESAALDKGFVENFQTLAHKHNLLPTQAQNLLKELEAYEVAENEKFLVDSKAAHEKSLSELKTEWAGAYQGKVDVANKVIDEFAGEEGIKHLKTLGLQNDTVLLRTLAKIGEGLYKEDSSSPREGTNTGGAKTRDELQRSINEMFSDKAYLDPRHADHKRKIDEMQSLYKERERYDQQAKKGII